MRDGDLSPARRARNCLTRRERVPTGAELATATKARRAFFQQTVRAGSKADRRGRGGVALLGALLAITHVTARAEDGVGIAEALAAGSVKLSFRQRFEFVDQDGLPQDAFASTLKTRLTLASGTWRDWQAHLEVDDLRPVLGDSFNSTRNDKARRPVVADPKGTDLNQAFVSYRGFKNAEIRLGRQRINRGDQRFIGGVGWRQNEQTYDAATFAYSPNDRWGVHYGYVHQVNRVFGPESGAPAADLSGQTHLLDVGYRLNDLITASGFAYLIDLDEGAPGLSNRTVGLALQGNLPLNGSRKLEFGLLFATQSEAGGNPVDYSADFLRLHAGYAFESVSLTVGLEHLEGSDRPGAAFRTPLATLHKFQGWADKFLATPTAGIDDLYLGATFKLLDGSMTVAYHDFSAETGGSDYGSEVNVSFSRKLGERYGLLAKAAAYDADEFATDTTKLWLMFTASF